MRQGQCEGGLGHAARDTLCVPSSSQTTVQTERIQGEPGPRGERRRVASPPAGRGPPSAGETLRWSRETGCCCSPGACSVQLPVKRVEKREFNRRRLPDPCRVLPAHTNPPPFNDVLGETSVQSELCPSTPNAGPAFHPIRFGCFARKAGSAMP